jgi:hypothetical protein
MTDRVTKGLSKFRDDGYAVVYAGLDSGALFELGSSIQSIRPRRLHLISGTARPNSNGRWSARYTRGLAGNSAKQGANGRIKCGRLYPKQSVPEFAGADRQLHH